jgi:hypothetical protein
VTICRTVERRTAAEADIWNPSKASASAAFILGGMHANLELPLLVGNFRSVAGPWITTAGVSASASTSRASARWGHDG